MSQNKPSGFFSTKCSTVLWAFLGILVILLLWIQTPWLILKAAEFYYGETPPFDVRGQFGDLYGATNALFSGLAFLGLIVAIQLQREDLAVNTNATQATNSWLEKQTNLAMATSQLEALRILLRQQKARLHALEPSYFRDPDYVDYSIDAITKLDADLNAHPQLCTTLTIRAQQNGAPAPLCSHPRKQEIADAIRLLRLHTERLLRAFKTLELDS